MKLLFIALGGAAGSVLRFLTSNWVSRHFSGAFPMATFVVNILGCFMAGLLVGLITNHFSNNENLRLLLLTGFCGGYTTFSAFAVENMKLFQNSHPLIAISYIFLSILIGLAAVWGGLSLVK
ncbi:MAG TPA: fluoride efflux transporter CrcB [Chitinophagaceae bacterium]|nr:fluoride efflux transporter CrcB [Chitinophagaceae bacterium]